MSQIEPGELGRLFVIAGAPAAGKSTLAAALSAGLAKSVCVDGDDLAAMVTAGAEPLTAEPTVEAVHQLFLRYAACMTVADVYRSAGFDAVIADDICGTYLQDFLEIAAPAPVHLVVLNPSMDALHEREEGRRKRAYVGGRTVEEQWHLMQEFTSQRGLWIDNTTLSVAHTVTHVLTNLDQALVQTAQAEAFE